MYCIIIFFTSNFCYAIFHVKRYVPATNAPALILQQHYNLRHVLVVKHRYSMQQYDVVVRSSMQQYVVVGTGSSRQQYVVVRSSTQQYVVVGSSTQFFLIPVVSLPTSTTYSTVDTKSTIRTYVVQYVHSQQREKTEFNAGRQCKRYPLESGSV